jgi:hypothetical protein
MTDFALFSLGPKMAALAWWTRLLPLAVIALALGRLVYRHHILKRCLGKLEELFSPLHAKHLLYRLRDQEIKHFSQLTSEKMKEFMEQAADQSFRWRFLKALYSTKK